MNLKSLIVYHSLQIISVIYSLFILELNHLNPSKHLQKVIAINFSFQLFGLLISHSMDSNKSVINYY